MNLTLINNKLENVSESWRNTVRDIKWQRFSLNRNTQILPNCQHIMSTDWTGKEDIIKAAELPYYDKFMAEGHKYVHDIIITSCKDLDDEAFELACPRLISLSLSICDEFLEKIVQLVATNPSLRNIAFHLGFTDGRRLVSIKSIPLVSIFRAGAKHLTSISIEYLPLHINRLSAILDELPMLQKLYIQACIVDDISDISIPPSTRQLNNNRKI